MKYTKEQIRQENDRVRKTLANGAGSRIVLTPGVAHSDNKGEILDMVKSFDSFDGGNDPHNEHDMGMFTLKGTKYMFKFDYYDQDLEYGVDPQEEDCIRVLTIMEASEY